MRSQHRTEICSIEERSCIRKYYVDGLSYRKIAKLIGRNVSTVSREIRRNCTHIPGKISEAVMDLMNELHDEYGEHFSQIFKTITVDNGSEFADFGKMEKWETKVFFAHPYTARERPQNERHNGLFRAFIPKGASLEQYTDEDILATEDEINGRPRRKLGYRTPDELFEAFLDTVYAA